MKWFDEPMEQVYYNPITDELRVFWTNFGAIVDFTDSGFSPNIYYMHLGEL